MPSVLTRFGLGNVPGGINLVVPGRVEVKLDKPFLGQTDVVMDVLTEIFLYTGYAIVKVLNADGVGWVSNLQFCSEEEALRQLGEKLPGGETRFYFNLMTGEMKLNQPLGILVGEHLAVYPWIDRWARELSDWNDEEGVVLRGFEAKRRATVTSAGVCAGCLINVERGRLLFFYVICENGEVCSKEFPISQIA